MAEFFTESPVNLALFNDDLAFAAHPAAAAGSVDVDACLAGRLDDRHPRPGLYRAAAGLKNDGVGRLTVRLAHLLPPS